MAAKEEFIQEYFRRWERDIAKAAELLAQPRYHLEAVLVLSCYLGAFATLRFPTLRDGEAYVELALNYSGRREFYEQIDLLFLYQWPRSKLKNNGNYRAFQNFKEVMEVIVRKFGPEDKLDQTNRDVKPSVVADIVRAVGGLTPASAAASAGVSLRSTMPWTISIRRTSVSRAFL